MKLFSPATLVIILLAVLLPACAPQVEDAPAYSADGSGDALTVSPESPSSSADQGTETAGEDDTSSLDTVDSDFNALDKALQ